jgi:hypothetical protein
MLFLLEWSYSPENRPKVLERFLTTGGGKLDKKAKLLGRWHEIGGNGGVAIIETSDPAAMARAANDWADLMEMRFAPVMDDATVFKLNKV